LRLPKPLLLQVTSCDGDAKAWYDHEACEVTVCYDNC
jgi:hypothetical protein